MAQNEKVPELTNGEFEDFVKKGIVVIDFFAVWCMPCLMMSSIMDELSEKFKGKVKFGKINVEDNQTLTQKFNVKSIPSIFILRNEKILKHFVGAISSENLEEEIRKYV